jgi:hypothetical protein
MSMKYLENRIQSTVPCEQPMHTLSIADSMKIPEILENWQLLRIKCRGGGGPQSFLRGPHLYADVVQM